MKVNTTKKNIISIYLVLSLLITGLIGFFILEDIVDDSGASATKYYVDLKGHGNYTSIQAAINAASVGDTIYVWAGTYYENLTIDKSLTIIGNGTINTTINGSGVDDVVKINANWVNFTGFTVESSGSDWWPTYDAGVKVDGVEHVHVYDVNVSDSLMGISLYNSNNNTIENNTILYNVTYGIQAYFSPDNRILNNTCSGSIIGIIGDYSYGSTILNNTCFGNYYGIYAYYCDYSIIKNNNCSANEIYSIYLDDSSYSKIENNYCSDGMLGIYIYYADADVVNNNTITNQSLAGIIIEYTNSMTIKNNTMTLCGISVFGYQQSQWDTHVIDINNTVNGKPVYYWKNRNSGTVPAGAGEVILACCSRVTVSNQNCSDGSLGIALGYSDNITVKNNNCSNNGFYGIYLQYSTSNEIMSNTCQLNSEYGIQLYSSNFNEIIDNTCTYAWRGISLYMSDSNIIDHNSILKCNYGIYAEEAMINEIINNTINSNRYYGIFFEFYADANYVINNTCNYNYEYGFYIEFSFGNTIINNSFSFNNDTGIYMEYSDDNIIYYNNISNNNYGINLMSAGRNDFYENTISFNLLTGFLISTNSDGNNIYHNLFISNTQQASNSGTNSWSWNQEGNYWDDYIGLDNGSNGRIAGDGIGDTNLPHPGPGCDNYPFVKPYGWLYPARPVLFDPGESVQDGDYTISWLTAARATGYVLEEVDNISFEAPIELYNGTDTDFVINEKPEGTYYYRVKSYNNFFTSNWSIIVDMVVDFPPTTPQNLVVSVYPGGNTLNISWMANIVETRYYELYCKNKTFNTWEVIANINHPMHTFNHTGLIDGEKYYYQLRALDFRNQTSGFSQIIDAVPVDSMAPNAPSRLNATAISDSAIKLMWEPNAESDVAGYIIYMNDTDEGPEGSFHVNYTAHGQNTSYIVPGLTEQITYYFKIVAFDEVPNNSSFSDIVFATPPDVTKPEPPAGLTVSNETYKNLTIHWNASSESDVVGYNLYRSLSFLGPFDKINTELINETQYVDDGLDEATIYYYVVTAVDDFDFESDFSEVIFGITFLAPYPPEINHSIADFEISEDGYDDSSINLYYWFKDINNDPLTFNCVEQDNIEVTFFPSNGTVILQPKKDWNGEVTLTFNCSDGVFEISDEVTITVTSVNDPPGAVEIIKPKDNIKIKEGEAVDLEGSCYDVDIPYGDTLTFKWSSSELGELGTGENLTDIYLGVGKHLITLEVTDNYGEISSASVRVIVEEKEEQKEPKSGYDMNIIYAGIGVVVIIIILVLVIFMVLKKKKSKEEGEEEIEEEEPSPQLMLPGTPGVMGAGAPVPGQPGQPGQIPPQFPFFPPMYMQQPGQPPVMIGPPGFIPPQPQPPVVPPSETPIAPAPETDMVPPVDEQPILPPGETEPSEDISTEIEPPEEPEEIPETRPDDSPDEGSLTNEDLADQQMEKAIESDSPYELQKKEVTSEDEPEE